MKKLLLFSLLLFLTKLNAQICLHAPQSYATTSNAPHAVRNADLDNNGIPDIITVNSVSNTSGGLSVFMNYNPSAGNFSPPITTTLVTTTNATDVAVADFDGDGFQDVVVANTGTNTVSFFPGNGNGTFNTAINITVGGYPESIAVANFGGDAKLDIAVVCNASSNMFVLINTGGFTFGSNQFTTNSSPVAIMPADFDGINGPDVAVMSGSGAVATYINNGSGGFSLQTNTITVSSGTGITIGDFNGDAKPDLAVSSGSSFNVSVFMNNAAGFSGASVFQAPSSVNYLEGINNADFDMNGTLDIAVVGYGTSSGVFILPGNGSGGFGAATLSLSFSTANSPISLIRGDYNVDGLQDLAFPLTGSNNANLLINAKPITSGPNAVCAGGTIVLNGNGATSYSWSPGGQTTNTISITPSSNTTYTVIGISGSCSASSAITVTVNALPTITTAASPTAICTGGQTSTLTASGTAVTYTWNTSATTNTITAAPPSNQTYTVTGTSAASCTNSAIVSLVVNATPTLTPNSTSPICSGTTLNFNTTGANTYSWSGPVAFTSTLPNPTIPNATPANAGTYTITGTSLAGCVQTNTINVIVNSLPIVTVNSATICVGSSGALTAGGANTYTWSTTQTGPTINPTPTVTTTYTVTGTAATGCINTATSTVTVHALPFVTPGPDQSICMGSIATYTASGAITYTWSTGATTSTATISPAFSTTITVQGTDANGCVGSNYASVGIHNLPNVTATVSPNTICIGSSATFSATGANTYMWSNGSSVAVMNDSPGATTIYTVTGTDINNCVKTATVNIVVNNLPTITVNSASICAGQTATLTANGATTYTWMPATGLSSTTGSPVNGTPATTTNYTVIGTDANGCSSIATSTITINALPFVTPGPDQSICMGGVATYTASGATTYTWSTSATTTTATISPAFSTTITVQGTDANGCVGSNYASVGVNSLPSINVVPPGGSNICAGQTTTFTASGATTYTWNPGSLSSPTVSLSPMTSTVYTVAGTSSQGCVGTRTVNVSVTANPTVTVNSANICIGDNATLTAAGASTYSWNTGATTSAINDNPLSTTVYTVTGSVGICTSIATTTITVNNLPIVTVNSYTTCPGYTTTLTAAGASTYSWSTSSTGTSISVNPTVTTDYTVTGTDINSCINTAVANISVNLFDDLSGTIYDTTTISGPNPLTHGGLVYLYTQQSGSTAIDTTGLLANGVFTSVSNTDGSYSFSQVPSGNYYLKAVADTNYYHGSIPTYFSTLSTPAYRWDSATAVTHTGCNAGNDAGHNITIIEIPAATGSGIISGTITADVTFGQRLSGGGHNQPMGAPLKGIDVKLGKNPGGGCSARTTADSTGAYQFTGVDTGSYNIYVDIPNFGMVTILTATITSVDSVSTNNNYCVDSTNIGLCSSSSAIKQVTANNNYQVLVYPNPNNGMVNLQMNDYENARVEVYSVIGQKVYAQPMQNNLQQLNLTTLVDGVYQIRILKNNTTVYQSKIIKQ